MIHHVRRRAVFQILLQLLATSGAGALDLTRFGGALQASEEASGHRQVGRPLDLKQQIGANLDLKLLGPKIVRSRNMTSAASDGPRSWSRQTAWPGRCSWRGNQFLNAAERSSFERIARPVSIGHGEKAGDVGNAVVVPEVIRFRGVAGLTDRGVEFRICQYPAARKPRFLLKSGKAVEHLSLLA